jgi:hypothetical protein
MDTAQTSAAFRRYGLRLRKVAAEAPLQAPVSKAIFGVSFLIER